MQYTYYRMDASRLTLAELWRCCNNPLEFAVAAAFKLFRVNLAPPFGVARSDRLVRYASAAVPEYARRKTSPLIEEAQALGMVPGFCYTLPTVGALQGFEWTMRGSEGTILLTVTCLRVTVGMAVQEKAVFACLSRLSDGRYLVTSGAKRQENPPPYCAGVYLPGKTMTEVLAQHRERLRNESVMAVSVADDEQMERVVFEHERGVMDYQIERRVFAPIPAEEVARLRNVPTPTDSAAGESAGSQRKPGMQGLEWVCWFALLFGIFLFSRGQGNQAQFVFRLLIVGGGLIGVLLFQIARLLRSKS